MYRHVAIYICGEKRMNRIFNPDSCQGGEGTKLCAYNVATNCNSTDGTTHMTSLRVEV